MEQIIKTLQDDIKQRWAGARPVYPWPWVHPAHVRVLLYAEGVLFDSGSQGFHGLKHVIATLRSSPWYWVKFDVTTVNRGPDPTAMQQNMTLDQLSLNANFDQVWLFGVSEGNLLSAAEQNAIADFMKQGGGVLATGDHASLGQGIAGAVPRAGQMRKYPAPPNTPPDYNSTLVKGYDGIYDFYDQSDDQPQSIRLRHYRLWDLFPRPFSRRWAPHPILCGVDGPITILPDHQHEGEAIIPSSFPAAEWPSKGGFQPRPEVIAWGLIKDPSATTHLGQEIGVVAAYDGHRADIGRVAADSTWHHFFDINLLGDPTLDPVNDNGFVATTAGQKALKHIENYYLNLAVWLATPAKQIAMRDAMWWGVIWTNKYWEMAATIDRVPIFWLGEQARDVFGRVATQCNRREWLFWEVLDPAIRLNLEKLLAEGAILPDTIEVFVLGSVLKKLIQHYGYSNERRSPGTPPRAAGVEKLLREATHEGLEAMRTHQEEVLGNSKLLLQGVKRE